MAEDPLASMMTAWKKATDDFFAAWAPMLQAAAKSEAGQAAAQEASKTYLGSQAAMAEAAKQVYGPMIAAAGAVPLTEFRRLQDQVQTMLLRLDRVDDVLREIRDAVRAAQPATLAVGSRLDPPAASTATRRTPRARTAKKA